MAGMDHRPSPEEQHRLEESVGHQMVHSRSRRSQLRPQADRHHHVSELRKRGIGEDTLDVVLLDRNQRGEQSREATDIPDDRARPEPAQEIQRSRPGAGRRVEEEHPAQHVNARRHHRRRMDQRRHRRRAFHGVRQPNMQRELRALAHRAHEHQQARDAGHRAEDRRIRPELRRKLREIQRPRRSPDHQDSQQEPEVTQTIAQEGLLGRIPRRRPFVPETDQQVRGHAYEFPEDEDHHQVVGQDDSQHREHEQAQRAEEPTVRPVIVHVTRRIDHHQTRNRRDHEGHQRRQPIDLQPDGEIEAGDRQPVEGGCRQRMIAGDAEKDDPEHQA